MYLEEARVVQAASDCLEYISNDRSAGPPSECASGSALTAS